jgi:hypothetical protein
MEPQKSNKWFKWVRIIGIIIIILYILFSLLILLGDSKGQKLQYDEFHSIYYSEEYFDPSFIRIVGDSLQKIGFFSPNSPSDIQLLRSPELGDTVVVGYLVNPNKLTPEIKEEFRLITKAIHPLLRTHTQIHFKDENFNTLDRMKME